MLKLKQRFVDTTIHPDHADMNWKAGSGLMFALWNENEKYHRLQCKFSPNSPRHTWSLLMGLLHGNKNGLFIFIQFNQYQQYNN